MAQADERTGILLIASGTPDSYSPEAVRSYLKDILSDRRFVPYSKPVWWGVMNARVLPKATESLSTKYRKVWTEDGDPLSVNLSLLAERLQLSWHREGHDVMVMPAMCFGQPSVENAMSALKDAGATRLVTVPLFPISSNTSVKVADDRVRTAFKALSWRPVLRAVSGYADHPLFAKTIVQSLLSAGFDPRGTDKVIFVFRSIPLADIDAGDTAELACGSALLAITRELGLARGRYALAYQGKIETTTPWLEPNLATVLEREAHCPKHRTFVICPGYAIDGVETLYDVDYRCRTSFLGQLAKAGIETDEGSFVFVPGLNASEAQVRLIAEVVRRACM